MGAGSFLGLFFVCPRRKLACDDFQATVDARSRLSPLRMTIRSLPAPQNSRIHLQIFLRTISIMSSRTSLPSQLAVSYPISSCARCDCGRLVLWETNKRRWEKSYFLHAVSSRLKKVERNLEKRQTVHNVIYHREPWEFEKLARECTSSVIITGCEMLPTKSDKSI